MASTILKAGRDKKKEKDGERSTSKKSKQIVDSNEGDKSWKVRKNKRAESKINDEKSGEQKEVWSKSKKKRMRLLKAKMKKQGSEISSHADSKDDEDQGKEVKSLPQSKNDETVKKESDDSKRGPSSLQKTYAARLTGSRFRILNEELYTTTSTTAVERFQSNPELFDQYHEGFRHQVEQWPSNPVDVILGWINKKYSKSKDTVVVADFGCGDAELARRLTMDKPESDQKEKKKKIEKSSCPFKVHSFDLISQSDLVTACDMANVPLENKSVDAVIFCLALMGTNVSDFIREAHRVLKDDGRVKIAEVRSRFESASGKDDLNEFAEQLSLLGFDCKHVDRSNKMFILMELKKNGKEPDRKVDVKIKPCIYKRR